MPEQLCIKMGGSNQDTQDIWRSNGEKSGTGALFTCGKAGKLYASIVCTKGENFSDSHSGDYGVYQSSLIKNGTTIATSNTSSQYVPSPNDNNSFYKRFVIDGVDVASGDVFGYGQTNQNGRGTSYAIWEAHIE